jgi:hypothetical protein
MISPACSDRAMNERCPLCGVRSTRPSRDAHGVSRPRSAAGATANGSRHDTLVASTLASVTIARDEVTGRESMSPRLCSRTHRSSCARPGSGPKVVAGGSAAHQPASPVTSVPGSYHTAEAARAMLCGCLSRASATSAASRGSIPSASARSWS